MPPITGAKLYEAFGLTPPETGAQEQAIAEPAAEPQTEPAGAPERETEGAEGREDPAAEAANTEPVAGSDDPEVPGKAAESSSGSERPEQTPEQRRANAARRRQQEQEEAVQQAVNAARQQEQARHQAAMDDIFARAGLKNTITGEPITNLEQFNDWHNQFEKAKLDRSLKGANISRETIEQLIAEHPDVKQAQQVTQQVMQAQRQQQAEADRARVEADIEQIRSLNPQIHSLADILAMETAPEFRNGVQKGLSFLEAYKLANMEAIAEEKAQRAREAAQSNTRGKDHLVATGNNRGGGSASVPPEQMRLFRQMNPNASADQIQKFYNNYLARKAKQGG